MSEAWSIAGGALLAVATVPQAVRLVKTRDVENITWAFAVLTLVGLVLLCIRSVEIREWAFVAINAFTACFWALVVALKADNHRRDLGVRPR